MIVTIEIETHTVIQHRPPTGQLNLPLEQARQAVIGRPSIEEISVRGHSLAEGGEEPRRQSRLTKVQM